MSHKLGRKPAVSDLRVPYLHTLALAKTLPPPPEWVNWYADVGDWSALGNDVAGCCVEAMAGHAVQQFASYADRVVVPTAAESLALYSEITGYDPTNPASDQGTVVLGPGGLIQHWLTKGVVFGGQRTFATGFAQVRVDDMTMLRQAVHFFGGVGLGLDLPDSVIEDADVPYMWDDAAGPTAGGHEVWLCGYDTSASGEAYWDFVSWGERYRMSEAFLLATAREAVCVYDPDSLNARGLNADDFDATQLFAAMAAIKDA
jgi:hypothetical protein